MADRAGVSTPGGRSKVWDVSEEDRRPHIKKVGALFRRNKNFPAPNTEPEPAQVDLFGHRRAKPAGIMAPCAECFEDFLRPVAQGRPQRFCSDECRKTSKHRQVKAWAAANPKPPAEDPTCRHCGAIFQPKPRTSGRRPHWCSARCKAASKRHAPIPAGEQSPFLFDL